MRQDPRELSYQDWFKWLRGIREDIYLLDVTLKANIKSVLVSETDHIKPDSVSSKQFIEGLDNTRRSLRSARNSLRETLEIGDTSGTYPDPVADLPGNPSPLPSGPGSIVEVIENIEENLKELLITTAEYHMEGWAVRYHEDAVMQITNAKHELRVTNALSDEKSATREKEPVQGGSDSLHNADTGFQASGRPGQHGE